MVGRTWWVWQARGGEIITAIVLLTSACLVSCIKVLPHDGCLVLQYGQLQGVADDIELLVAKIQAIVLWLVSEEIHRPGDGATGNSEKVSMHHETQTLNWII